MKLSLDQAGKARNKTCHPKLLSLPSLKQEPGTLGFTVSDEKGGVKGRG